MATHGPDTGEAAWARIRSGRRSSSFRRCMRQHTVRDRVLAVNTRRRLWVSVRDDGAAALVVHHTTHRRIASQYSEAAMDNQGRCLTILSERANKTLILEALCRHFDR